jgi:hypothetical protein
LRVNPAPTAEFIIIDPLLGSRYQRSFSYRCCRCALISYLHHYAYTLNGVKVYDRRYSGVGLRNFGLIVGAGLISQAIATLLWLSEMVVLVAVEP